MEKRMTVMIYFAADNPLSPIVVQQLKAIKDAGFEANTDVIVHFDPNEKSAPTRIYDVNKSRRAAELAAGADGTEIGDREDPFVRNMMEDNVDPEYIDESKGKFSVAMKKALSGAEEVDASTSLRNFIGYCLENHPAKHYLLFLVGHGMIVGNDTFLPDDNPSTAISLIELEDILSVFSKAPVGTLELVGMHSCSMSAFEVAFQLKSVTKYIIASQGTTYVGSWPYRQLLKKIFHTVKRAMRDGKEINIPQLVEKIYSLSLFNSTDFMIAGYSSELALCNLQNVGAIKDPLQAFIRMLKDGLVNASSPLTELIINAHWESQAYWSDSYTDLCDFCDCLMEGCDKRLRPLLPLVLSSDDESVAGKGMKAMVDELEGIKTACKELTSALEVNRSRKIDERFSKLVVRSEHFGWKYQYSHGLSVYFPWSEPLDVEATSDVPTVSRPRQQGNQSQSRHDRIMQNYEQYKFTTEMAGDSWFEFLVGYFKKTERRSRLQEGGDFDSARLKFDQIGFDDNEFARLLSVARESFDVDGSLDHKTGGAEGPGDHKTGSAEGLCDCPSIKNFPVDRDGKRRVRKFSISPGALRAFKRGRMPDINAADKEDFD